MSNKCVHKINVSSPETRHLASQLLTELQNATIRTQTPIGPAITMIVNSWKQDDTGNFLVQFTSMAANLLPPLTDIELLESAVHLVRKDDRRLISPERFFADTSEGIQTLATH